MQINPLCNVHSCSKIWLIFLGLLSLQEAAYHSVPVLGLPVFGDQDINIRNAANLGFGLFQEILDVTEENLLAKIKQILTEPRYNHHHK